MRRGPWWVRWAGRLAPPDLRDAFLDDLDETYEAEAARRSLSGRAWWWVSQVPLLYDLLRLRARHRHMLPADGHRRSPWSGVGQDVTSALRILRQAPGFAIMAIGTLALGIGANTAIFSLVKAVLLAPLPYADPDRLVLIWRPGGHNDVTWLAAPEIDSYRNRVRGVTALAAYTTDDANLTEGGEPERVHVGDITADLFNVLGVPARLGRALEPADGEPGAAPVIVLSDALWRRRFGGDPSVVGRSIDVDDRARLVVGVMPARFRLPLDYQTDQPTEAWQPLVFTPADLQSWGDHSYFGIARLRAGVTPAAVTAEFLATETSWVRDGFRRDPGTAAWHRSAVPLGAFLTAPARRPLLILLAAVVGVLLVACGNVVNLLVARADARRHEVLVRAALGARRSLLVRQALIEGLVLAAVGALVGLAVAKASLSLLQTLRPADLPRATDVALDGGVLLFTALVALGSALLVAIGPAVVAARTDLADALRASGRTLTLSPARRRFGRLLVMGQLACSLVLVIGAGLFGRTILELYHVDLGFNPHHVLTAELQLPVSRYPEPGQVVRFYQAVVDRLGSVQGVQAAAAIRVLPLSRVIGNWSITVEGHPSTPSENPNGDYQWATPDYFLAIGAHLERGRFFTQADREGTPLVAVLNETMARRYWPGEDALGRRFHMGTMSQPWITVVGIIRDTHHDSVVEGPRAEMYLLHAQLPTAVGGEARAMNLVLRTGGAPLTYVAALRDAVRAVDPRLPVARVRTLDEVVAASLSPTRFAATLLAMFAGLALLLAAIGTYGTMSVVVASRTAELGIRLALGAKRSAIARLVVGQAMGTALFGVTLGLAVAVALTHAVGALLYGVRPIDPWTFTVAPLTLLGVTLVAGAGPARRAARLDPVVTLRES